MIWEAGAKGGNLQGTAGAIIGLERKGKERRGKRKGDRRSREAIGIARGRERRPVPNGA